jgi:hypothetical protein
MPRCALVLLLLLAACGSHPAAKTSSTAKDTLTQRQRDSITAQSGIPGAKGIGAAQRVADSLNAQNARLDSIH